MWSVLMKLDDIALNNVLKAYGHELKPLRGEKKPQKPEISTKPNDPNPQNTEDMKVSRYDKDGFVVENSDKKKQLIDFFE
jgi:hypothetical protein